jgi:glycosyltransferase involved in cell wall biosynthesis
VKSILSQTLKDIELIIIDDGSTDGSEGIIQSLNDDRVIYQKLEKNMGVATATNFGHNLVRGQYIAHMDQDDIAMPNRLDLQMSFLEKFQSVHVVGGKMEIFGAKHYRAYAPTSDGEIKANFLFGAANICNPTAMFRHSFMKKNNLNVIDLLKSTIMNFGYKPCCGAHVLPILRRLFYVTVLMKSKPLRICSVFRMNLQKPDFLS